MSIPTYAATKDAAIIKDGSTGRLMWAVYTKRRQTIPNPEVPREKWHKTLLFDNQTQALAHCAENGLCVVFCEPIKSGRQEDQPETIFVKRASGYISGYFMCYDHIESWFKIDNDKERAVIFDSKEAAEQVVNYFGGDLHISNY